MINTIMPGDCREWLPIIEDESIDLVVTDPPYLVQYFTRHRKDKQHKFCSEIKNDRLTDKSLLKTVFVECFRVLKPNTAAYVFCDITKRHIIVDYLEQAGFSIKNTIIWVKNNWTAGDLKAQFGKQYECILLANKGRCFINGKRIPDVWYFKRVVGNHQLHQNQKPTDLLCQCIEKHTKLGSIILDPFMGCGSTAIACMQSGRNFVGFELDPIYYDIAIKRIEEFNSE